MNRRRRELISALSAGGVLLGLSLGIGVPVLWAGVAGIVVYSGLKMVLPKKPEQVAPGILRKEWHATVKRGQTVANRMYYMSGNTKHPEVAKHIREIAQICREITTMLRKDATYFPSLDFFLNTQIDDLMSVLEQYAQLSTLAEKDTDIAESLNERERLIIAIKEKFQDQHERLLKRDLTKFEVASDTLSSMLGVEEFDYAKVKESSLRQNRQQSHRELE